MIALSGALDGFRRPFPFYSFCRLYADQVGRNPHPVVRSHPQDRRRSAAKGFYAPIPRPSNPRERIAMMGRLDSAELASEMGSKIARCSRRRRDRRRLRFPFTSLGKNSRFLRRGARCDMLDKMGGDMVRPRINPRPPKNGAAGQ
jgi:hypothetical protein